MPEFVRESLLGTCTVFDRLVGMPVAMISVRTICVHGDEGEMNIWTLWCIHAVQLVVRTHHTYMFMAGTCTSCRVLFIP
jgi:hypothetical protein